MLELAGGMGVVPGIVRGKCRIVATEADVASVIPGEIVVLPNSDPLYTMAVFKAGGIICAIGGKLSHICIIAMEMGTVCLTNFSLASELKTGQDVLIDTYKELVYVFD